MRIFLCILLVVGSFAVADAGTISITTHPVARVEGDRVRVVIKVTNNGDAAAHEVRADAEVLGERFGSQVHAELGPGKSTDFRFDRVLHPSLKGTFPLKVLVHFQDANRYPFSALACTTFFVREKGDGRITAAAAPLSMNDDGTIQVQVRNSGPSARQVRASLHLPNEFYCDRPSLSYSLAAGEKRNLSFPIRNFSAIHGAVYPVYMIQEYEEGGTRSSSLSTIVVKVVNQGNWFRRNRWYWAGGSVLLIGFLLIQTVTTRKFKLTNTSKYR